MSKKELENKPLEKILNIRVSSELAEALEETKWSLRKSMSELVRDAVLEYLSNNLSGDVKKKVSKILNGKAR